MNNNINLMSRIHKFTSPNILIPNKYELQCYCKLYMIIYFANN